MAVGVAWCGCVYMSFERSYLIEAWPIMASSSGCWSFGPKLVDFASAMEDCQGICEAAMAVACQRLIPARLAVWLPRVLVVNFLLCGVLFVISWAS